MCVICHILYTLDIPQILHSVYKTFWHLGFSFTYDAPKILKKMTIDVTSAAYLNTLRNRLKTLHQSLPVLTFPLIMTISMMLNHLQISFVFSDVNVFLCFIVCLSTVIKGHKRFVGLDLHCDLRKPGKLARVVFVQTLIYCCLCSIFLAWDLFVHSGCIMGRSRLLLQ